MTQARTVAAFLTAAFLVFPGAAAANSVNTAGETGAYQKDFCPGLTRELSAAKFDYKCAPSAGAVENITRVLNNPQQIGFAQFDIYARETAKLGGAPLTMIRNDIGRECLFMVTKNKTFKTYGEVASLAPDLRFVLPPQGSGSAATFEFLQKIDPEGLGKARAITYAESPDAAIEQALSGDDNVVTLFVQFPDPENPRFKAIDEKAGQFIPVIDRAILRQETGGEKIYYAQETEISNAKFLKKGQTVITSCTPVTLFTGSPEAIAGKAPAPGGAGPGKADHEDLIRTIRALDRTALLPAEGFFSSLWKRTKELSAEGVEQAVEFSEKAREQSKPYIDRAKEMGQKAIEKAGELSERAKREANELMQKDQKTQ